MGDFFKIFRAALIGCLVILAVPASQSAAGLSNKQVKVVYHLSEGIDQAASALHKIRNHLDVDPNAKITVVAVDYGVDFLLEGAKDKNNNPFDATVQTLVSRGVDFRVCNNTLIGRNIDRHKVIPEAKIIPAGMPEIARLEAEGYGYIKP
ncbi:signal peptide protein [Pandoraea terrae]|uniref:Signal peptide protein n=1 Tax=Pandoraea terrae TaxID=1537710 RepID=A0A5E4Y1I1_9BURK|nr:DsrE family protein [Pandoraea terrae]VVE42397.1 signal peptide protein [Pandoraea terrae]